MFALDKVKSKKHQGLEKRSFESPDFPSSEHRGVLIFEKNAGLIGEDAVFKKIFDSVIGGWNYIDKKQHKEILDLVEDLIEKLKEYHDSYLGLKKLGEKRFFIQDVEDREKYQRASENADKRERALHNAFIDTLNILSRRMKTMGLDNSWRADDEIYGLTPDAAREKPKLWMLKIFKEEIPKPRAIG